jgi:LmbE family N-acetylglucosaminyl deacetylase
MIQAGNSDVGGNASLRDIRSGSIPKHLRVLLLAPHPDDFDAVGVTLKFLATNGNPLQVGVALTGSGVEDAYRPGLSLAGKTQLREREQRNSLRFFGLPEECMTFLRLANDAADQLTDSEANRDVLDAFVRARAPELVILPHGNDTNSAHRALYALVRRIAGGLGRPLILWLCRDPKTIAMRYDEYLAFGEEEAAWKAALLRFHDSQQQRNLNTRGYGFDRRLLDVNRASACELGIREPYAEVFEREDAGLPVGSK